MILLALVLLKQRQTNFPDTDCFIDFRQQVYNIPFFKDYGLLMISNGFMDDYANIMESRDQDRFRVSSAVV